MSVDVSKIALNLQLEQDGLWASPADSNVSYPEIGNETCFAVEEASFWFNHRNNCILQALKRFPPSGTFFDVGGGNGYVAGAIQQAGINVVLVEPGRVGARNAMNRGIRQVIRSTLHDAGFLPETLPAVGLFDVVEHIEDDRTFLMEIKRLLGPGGRIYLTVPAFQWLWSHEDEHAGHWRRYTLKSISETLEASGYVIEFATYFFGFLPLASFLLRVLPYRLGFAGKNSSHESVHSDHNPTNAYVKRVLNMLSGRELSKIAARQLPRIGGSCLVVARKVEPHKP